MAAASMAEAMTAAISISYCAARNSLRSTRRRSADFTEALQDSTIPFLVEVRDWARLPTSFHHEIEREHVVLVAASGEAFAERNAAAGRNDSQQPNN